MQVDLSKYVLWYLATVLGMIALAILLAVAFGFALPNGVATILPPMLAAMLEGQRIARHTRTKMQNRAAWYQASRMTVTAVAINIIFAGVAFAIPQIRAMLGAIPPMAFVILGGLFLAVVFFVNRFFLTIGINNELKAIERREAES